MSLHKVQCKECGYEFSRDANLNEISTPSCPTCGSTKREILVSVKGTVHATGSVKARVIPSNATVLLMQAVIKPAAKTKEGILISAVSVPWLDIVNKLIEDPSFVNHISPEKWEEIIAGAYKKSGFDEVTLTPRSGDFGRDIIAIKKGIGSIRVIDQVKAYRPQHLVTANDVRALMGVLEGDKASKGFVTTTSDFAPRIKDDPFIKPFIPSRIELINGEELLKRLKELSNQ